MENGKVKLHMRTINEAAAYYKEFDPDTKINAPMIRRFVKSGEIPCVKLGNRTLVAIEVLDEFFKGEKKQLPPERNMARGVIRPVEV
jgi:hypothetical protein